MTGKHRAEREGSGINKGHRDGKHICTLHWSTNQEAIGADEMSVHLLKGWLIAISLF